LKKEIYLLTESDGFFGCRAMPWESMDVHRITTNLKKQFSVVRITYSDIAVGAVHPRNAIIIHSSSQQPEYKAFIDDILLFLECSVNRLVPSLNATRSHENKGFQELHKRLRGIRSAPAIYAAKPSEIALSQVAFPVVFKEVSGYGSSGVRLLKSQEDLANAVRAEVRMSWQDLLLSGKRWLGYLFRKLVLRRKNLRPYGDYYRPLKRFVLQAFVPDLRYDYNVLAFQNRFFVLKREARPNDFRASGSGRFSFVCPPAGLLDFAEDMLRRFDEPYMSFDICDDGTQFHLIEFQGVHFGPYTLTAAPNHFRKTRGNWETVEGRVDLEETIAESLIAFLLREPSETAASELSEARF
jgi:hypothetical protein